MVIPATQQRLPLWAPATDRNRTGAEPALAVSRLTATPTSSFAVEALHQMRTLPSAAGGVPTYAHL